MDQRLTKSVDILLLVSWIFLILIFVYLLYFSLEYFNSVVFTIDEPRQRIFFVSMTSAIVTALAQWINGRIKAVMDIIDKLKGGNKT